MNTNERVKAIRKALNLTQQQFAESINMSRNMIAMLEMGQRELSERTRADICRTHGVNESWIRDGIGDMFQPKTVEDEIASFMGEMEKLPEDDPRRAIMRMLAQLDFEDWKTIAHMIDILKKA